jgi:hypothetical protein
MEAILHLGDMKCGSKSIQEWMLQDAALLEENGFYQSVTTKIGIYDSRLSSYGLDDRRLNYNPRRECGIRRAADVPTHRLEIERQLTDEVAALPATARAMVFSHEMLLSLHRLEADRLLAMLGRIFSGIRAVAYIRRQDRLILSLWGQRMKTHGPDSRFCDRHIRDRSYLKRLTVWEQTLGRGRFAVRVFDRSAFAGTNLQAHFRSAAGIPEDPRYREPGLRNESLDAAAQTLLLHLRDRLVQRQKWGWRRIVVPLGRLLRAQAPSREEPIKFPSRLSAFLMTHRQGRGLLPGRDWARSVVAAFGRENDEIHRRYFPDSPRLFDDDFSEYPAQGGPPGADYPPLDPDSLAGGPALPPEPADIAEAYGLLLGRHPSQREMIAARQDAANIAHLYALLLTRSGAAALEAA